MRSRHGVPAMLACERRHGLRGYRHAGKPTTLAPTRAEETKRVRAEWPRRPATSANETHPRATRSRDAAPGPANQARDLPEFQQRHPQQSEDWRLLPQARRGVAFTFRCTRRQCLITLEVTGPQHLRRSRLLMLWVRVGRLVIGSRRGQSQRRQRAEAQLAPAMPASVRL